MLRGVGFPLGVTISDDESCNGDQGSLADPKVNICGAGTREGVCTKCTKNEKIFSIDIILAESLSYPIFVKSAGIN